jgi:hypothetical protein
VDMNFRLRLRGVGRIAEVMALRTLVQNQRTRFQGAEQTEHGLPGKILADTGSPRPRQAQGAYTDVIHCVLL